MRFFKEFKEFAVKGNMMEIAIGVIIGAAFNKVVDSLVKEVLMPPLSLMTDGVKMENRKVILRDTVMKGEETMQAEVAIGYGKLLETSLDFVIIAFTVFIIVKLMHSLRKKADDPKDVSVPTPKNIELLSKIHELMEKQIQLLEKRN